MTRVDVAASIAALGMLVLCLAGAAAGVRATSKDARCMQNLSQTGMASSIYSAQDAADMALPVHHLQFAQDSDDPTFIGAYEWGGKSGRGWDTWLGPADPLNSKYGTRAGFGPNTRPLNKIIYPESFADHLNPEFDADGAAADTQLELDVQHCPADTGYTGVHFPTFRDSKLSSFDHFGTSYAANVFQIASSGGGTIFSNSPYLKRQADIFNPATTLAYYENNGRYAWSAGPQKPECEYLGKVPEGPVLGWHGKHWIFNAVFVDGHVDSIYVRGFANPPLPYCPAFGSITTDCDLYRCTIIRGEGWQIDTLPVELVNTGLQWSGFGRPSWEHGIE